MGREIKRVALDFGWPLHMQWKGYMCPYTAQKCTVCDGSGHNPETKKISDGWYDFERAGTRWCDKITQDECDALVEHGRLKEFTHHFVSGQGWIENDPPTVVTSEMVNRNSGMHDAINRWICIETRAKRLGVDGDCPVCEGHGEIWFNDHIRELSDKWYDNERYEPPAGNGWQVWENVSEGSPISPVFKTRAECEDWVVRNEKCTPEAAHRFCDKGHAFSMMIGPSGVKMGAQMYEDE